MKYHVFKSIMENEAFAPKEQMQAFKYPSTKKQGKSREIFLEKVVKK